jgi:hypothetical protein
VLIAPGDRLIGVGPTQRVNGSNTRRQAQRALPVRVYCSGKRFYFLALVGGKCQYRGKFATAEEASAAYQQAVAQADKNCEQAA